MQVGEAMQNDKGNNGLKRRKFTPNRTRFLRDAAL